MLKKEKKKITKSPNKNGSSSKPEGPSHTPPRGKGKEAEHTAGEESHEEQYVKSSSESEKDSQTGDDPHAKRMLELETRLDAITHRGELQEVGVVRPYPVEWNDAPYPPKFKAPSLHTFDGKGSPNQHIYYFKSQTGNVVLNDALLVRLFIGTLKGVAFEWFMKLPAGSIKKWGDLERLFLAHFFEDDTEVNLPTLLAAK